MDNTAYFQPGVIPGPISALLDELAEPNCVRPDIKVQEVRRQIQDAVAHPAPPPVAAPSPLTPAPARSPAADALVVLAASTGKLRLAGGLLTASTLGLLVFCVLAVAARTAVFGACPVTELVRVLIGWGIGNMALAVCHETLGRYGAIVFLEVSEELDWHIDGEGGAGLGRRAAHPSHRPPIATRIALRNYGRHADLPLLPGRWGSASYAALNAVLPLLVWAWLLGSQRG